MDAFYENGHHTALLFAQYETNLFENLSTLLDKIHSRSDSWLKNITLTGSHAIILKSINYVEDCKVHSRKDKEFIFYSDTRRQWNNTSSVDVGFRIIGQHPIEFHILSSLWIDKVGYRLETAVSENSYGCRLKRPGQKADKFIPATHEHSKIVPDRYQLGHFRSYFGDYKRWQTNGIKAIKSSLKVDKKIIAMTADLTKFYHRIDPHFLLTEDFLQELELDGYSEEEKRLTEMLVTAISAWSNNVVNNPIIPNEFKTNHHCGVPLGLGASKVIANLLLTYLDREVERELLPIYYGRYVDDIFLVLEDNGKINTRDEFWAFLSKRMEHLIPSEVATQNGLQEGPEFKIFYADQSFIQFGSGKEKLFFLEGSSGESFIDTLQESLNENSSEWKMLPDSEEDLESLSQEMAKASSDLEEAVNGLRKSDGLSIQRLKFALHLRNFEAIVGLLPKPLWDQGLKKIFTLAKDFVITSDKIATYSKYYPRMLRLAIRADEPTTASEIWEHINASWESLKSKSNRSQRGLITIASGYNTKLLIEAVYTSISIDTKKYNTSKKWRSLFEKTRIPNETLSHFSELIFFNDLHAIPFRRVFFEDELPNAWGQQVYGLTPFTVITHLNDDIFNIAERIDFIKNTLRSTLQRKKNESSFLPKALFFYTRPFKTLEVSELYPAWTSPEGLVNINKFLSLFNIPSFDANITPNTNEEFEEKHSKIIQLNINNDDENLNRVFALTSFQTDENSWVAWVRDDQKEPDGERYSRLFKLINDVLRCHKKKIDYLVFPELSIPRKVLTYVALKLKTKQISLIAGIEYEKRDAPGHLPKAVKGLVSNQLVYILNTKTKGSLQQVCIIQEKTIPAIHEEKELFSIGGKLMVPKNENKYLINHGGFFFSGLICNDLLNLENRHSLRGRIDALIVIEWNMDVETYDSLVQSSSGDLHSFIIQVNNRKYGDTRLRGPYKESYERDKVRIRGGELDYFVVTTLEVKELREFQRNHRSPEKPFKPVPTGFLMSIKRRIINK
jgi:hypothetical protein